MSAAQSSLLNLPVVSRIRRNHALEHATLNVLARRFPRLSMAGHSDAAGYWIIGELATGELETAAAEARRRLLKGERSLAIHPFCGTNFVVSGTLAGTAAFLALFGAPSLRSRLERLPAAISLATLALVLAQPLGFFVQEHITTSGELAELEIESITPSSRGGMTAHRVLTRG